MEATHNDLQELKRILAAGSTPYVEALIKNEIAKVEAALGVNTEKNVQTEARLQHQRKYTKQFLNMLSVILLKRQQLSSRIFADLNKQKLHSNQRKENVLSVLIVKSKICQTSN